MGSSVALAGLLFYAGDPTSFDWWLFAVPFGLWVIGPAIAPWIVARWRRQSAVTIALLIFLSISSLASALSYYDAFFRSTSSTSALILIFLPLYQWVAFAIIATIALAISAGRTSER